MTEFVIRAITDKPITVVESAGEILSELKRQGNNLNQAVRKGVFHRDYLIPSDGGIAISYATFPLLGYLCYSWVGFGITPTQL